MAEHHSLSVKFTPRPEQQQRVDAILAEPTKSYLLGDDMGVGKTMVGVETILQGEFERVLVLGVKDTFDAWAERLSLQSDGRVQLRRIDSTKAGKANLAAMLRGDAGVFFAGTQFLVRQDWEYSPAFDDDGETPLWRRHKSTNERQGKIKGELELRPRPDAAFRTAEHIVPIACAWPLAEIGVEHTHFTFAYVETAAKPGMIGPAGEPIRESARTQLGAYRKMKPLDLIVFDEVHMVANRQAIGRATVRTIRSEWKLGMSGTWQGNKFENAWSITRWLWPDLIDPNFWRWRGEWCETETVRVAGGKERETVKGEKVPGEFVKTLPGYMRAEAAEKAPAPRVLKVALTPRQRVQYDTLEADLVAWITDKQRQGRSPLIADLPVTLRMRLRTACLGELSFNAEGDVDFDVDCQSSKLDVLSRVLYRYGAQPVGIYVESKKFAKVVHERMRRAGLSVALWSGDVPSKERAEIKRRFLSGEIQYLISVIAAFSTGLDGFQRVCNKLVWLNETENVTMNDQALGRYFRHGRKPDTATDRFEQVKIIAEGTLEEGIFGSLVSQRLMMSKQMRDAASWKEAA